MGNAKRIKTLKKTYLDDDNRTGPDVYICFPRNPIYRVLYTLMRTHKHTQTHTTPSLPSPHTYTGCNRNIKQDRQVSNKFNVKVPVNYSWYPEMTTDGNIFPRTYFTLFLDRSLQNGESRRTGSRLLQSCATARSTGAWVTNLVTCIFILPSLDSTNPRYRFFALVYCRYSVVVFTIG